MNNLSLLVLDRDGVINPHNGYVYKIDEFSFTDGIFDLCKIAELHGCEIVVATNQAGIARGLYSEQEFQELTDWMVMVFLENGIKIKKVFYCPHHPAFPSSGNSNCKCRKPKPGMLESAKSLVPASNSRCIVIGDSESDLEAGRRAGFGVRVAIGLKSKVATHDFNTIRNLVTWAENSWFF